MAFDFPASPTPGQTFYDPASGARYTYSNGVWTQVASSPVLKGTTGDAPPSNPDPGQLWWESDTGRMFIYYNDGNSSQWVQISGTAQPGTTGYRELVQEQNLNNVVNFAFDYFTGWPDQYDDFEIELINYTHTTQAAYVAMRIKTGNPGVVQAGASNYGWNNWIVGYGGGGAGEGSTGGATPGSTLIALSRGAATTTYVPTGVKGNNYWNIRFRNPTKQGALAAFTPFIWDATVYESSIGVVRETGSGVYASSVALTGLHFLCNAGAVANISCQARLWGRRS